MQFYFHRKLPLAIIKDYAHWSPSTKYVEQTLATSSSASTSLTHQRRHHTLVHEASGKMSDEYSLQNIQRWIKSDSFLSLCGIQQATLQRTIFYNDGKLPLACS